MKNGFNGAHGTNPAVLDRNIAALLAHREAKEELATWKDRLAANVSNFAGSIAFVWLHLAVLVLWILVNVGLIPGIWRFDPSFVFLATVASVEALFLSAFILIAQNRMQKLADRRADLNLQISLLTEHEITRLIHMIAEIGVGMNLPSAHHPELTELKKNVDPEENLKRWSSGRRRADLTTDFKCHFQCGSNP